MNNLWQTLSVELLKARRSKVPLLTALAFMLAPFVGGFFMIILKDPETARNLGVISTKAQIVGGTADWPNYLGLLAQTVAIGGIILFGFIISWVFGREFVDRTAKDLLALPTSRSTIVAAKFILTALWTGLLAILIYLVGLVVGAIITLPLGSAEVLRQGTLLMASTIGLTIALVLPFAFFASLGRGYLLPLGATIFAVALAQIVAAAGWGEYFPWAIPALLSGMAGPEHANLGPLSYLIVLLTAAAGLTATFAWWNRADQTK